MQSVRPHPTVPARSGPVRSLLGLAAVALAAAAFVACASSKPGVKGGVGGDLTFTSLSNNTRMRLVSDSWVESKGFEGVDAEERRADFYGKNVYTLGSGAPALKVCEDALFDGVVQALDQQGFAQYAARGSALASGSGAGQFLELSIDGQVRHFALTKGMSIEAKQAYHKCLSVFFDVFNEIEGYQSGDGSFQFDSKSKAAGR